jgi:hypothetical protein
MLAVGTSLIAAALERAAVATAFGTIRHTFALLILFLVIDQVARRRLPVLAPLTTEAPEASADPLRLSG